MSTSHRAPKPRYVLTQDRDRIAMAAGAICSFVVMAVSIFVQRHALLETIFRAAVAMVIVYPAAHVVLLMIAHLRETQSIVEETESETDVEEPETE